jgi:hypothetical protein
LDQGHIHQYENPMGHCLPWTHEEPPTGNEDCAPRLDHQRVHCAVLHIDQSVIRISLISFEHPERLADRKEIADRPTSLMNVAIGGLLWLSVLYNGNVKEALHHLIMRGWHSDAFFCTSLILFLVGYIVGARGGKGVA